MTARGFTALVAGGCVVALVATTAGIAQVPQGQAQAQGQPAGRGQQPGGRAGGGGRGGPQPQAPQVLDAMQMLSALPDRAPATPKQPRRVLVLGKAGGFVHSSIPLAARTIEALGMKTGAWTTVISFNAADINPTNLAQYDAIYLASTTGHFLDEQNPNNDPAITATNDGRRKALMDFVRGGKGLAGVHASTDSYHGRGPAPAGAAPAAAAPGGAAGGRGGGGPRMGTWQDFNHMIGGFFKFHWNYPTQIAVKVEDVNNPINAPFTTLNAQTGQRQPRTFSIVDEVYTFEQNSWSRERVHVLTSIDYEKMPPQVKEQEPANGRRTDGDYGLSYIRREGKGRVFVNVLGHHESIYKDRPMLEHTLAGMQYVLGDLEGVDDSPSLKR